MVSLLLVEKKSIWHNISKVIKTPFLHGYHSLANTRMVMEFIDTKFVDLSHRLPYPFIKI